MLPDAETTLRRLLLSIAVGLAAVDCVWAAFGGFKLEPSEYFGVAALSAALLMGSEFYRTVRVDRRLSAMLFGTAFLIAFSAGLSVLNYFLLTVAGGRRRQAGGDRGASGL